MEGIRKIQVFFVVEDDTLRRFPISSCTTALLGPIRMTVEYSVPGNRHKWRRKCSNEQPNGHCSTVSIELCKKSTLSMPIPTAMVPIKMGVSLLNQEAKCCSLSSA